MPNLAPNLDARETPELFTRQPGARKLAPRYAAAMGSGEATAIDP